MPCRPGPPDQLVAVEAEIIAGGLQVAPIAQLEGGVEMPVGVGLHQVDGVVVGTAAQEREEIAHPVGFAEAEHVAIELGHLLHVGDEEGDVAELVRHDPLGRVALARERFALEHLDGGALRVLEGEQVGDRRLRVLLALGLQPVALDLALERGEVVLGRDLEAQPHAFRLRSLAQHHRVMIDRRGQIDRILVLAGDGEAENLGVVFGLLVQIGHFVDGVGDLLDADHANLRSCLFECAQAFRGGKAPMTSTMTATSCSARPISMALS